MCVIILGKSIILEFLCFLVASMAEPLWFFTKGGLVIKPQRNSLARLRMLVLTFAMVFGLYICLFSLCLKQTSIHNNSNRHLNVRVKTSVHNITKYPKITQQTNAHNTTNRKYFNVTERNSVSTTKYLNIKVHSSIHNTKNQNLKEQTHVHPTKCRNVMEQTNIQNTIKYLNVKEETSVNINVTKHTNTTNYQNIMDQNNIRNTTNYLNVKDQTSVNNTNVTEHIVVHNSTNYRSVKGHKCVHNTTKYKNLTVNQSRCDDNRVDRSRFPYVHFPKPTTFSREECACTPVQPFSIISMQRSGSRWLETLLNSHTNVSSNGEIFYEEEKRRNFPSILYTLDKVYNLDLSATGNKSECIAAIGFKWMLNQGLVENHKSIAEYFKDRGVSVIFLFRRNLLRRMVSLFANMYDQSAKLLNGTHKAHVQSDEEAKTLSRYKPVLNSKSLVMDLKIMDKMIFEALEYFGSARHIILYYEDLVKNQTKLVEVQRFLGLPEMKLTSRNVKIHKGSVLKHIKNRDEVNRTLRGTVYESFLHTD